jgi:hypothetical protein
MTWRGVVRWGLRGFGALVILVLVWLLFGRIHAARRLDAARETFKQNVGPLELSAWASPQVPDEENAAIPIRSGALGVVLSKEDRRVLGDLTRNPTDAMTPEQVRSLRRILETNGAALAAIDKGARLERSDFGDDLRLDMPPLDADGKPRIDTLGKGRAALVEIMNVARIVRAKARLERLDGDREQMLATLQTGFGLARAVYQEPRVISQLIANAGERIGLGEVTSVATSDSTTPAELQRMQAAMLSNDLRATWKRVQAADTLMLVQGLERSLTSHRLSDVDFWGRAGRAIWRPVTQAALLELGTEYVGFVDQPAGLRGPAPEVMTGGARLRWRLLRLVSPFTATKELLRSMSLKESLGSSGRLQATMSQRRLVRLVLALRVQGLATGTYPQDLSGFPEAGTPDPFTGKLLAYERRTDGSAVLSIPDGEALWKQVTGGMPTPCPFSVTLPPPAKPTARGAA